MMRRSKLFNIICCASNDGNCLTLRRTSDFLILVRHVYLLAYLFNKSNAACNNNECKHACSDVKYLVFKKVAIFGVFVINYRVTLNTP